MQQLHEREFQCFPIPGRLAGLLGNYNNEPSDDRQGPDGQATGSPAQLATWWAVGDKPCYQVRPAWHHCTVACLCLYTIAECDKCSPLHHAHT